MSTTDTNNHKFAVDELVIDDESKVNYSDIYSAIESDNSCGMRLSFSNNKVTKGNLIYLRIDNIQKIILRFLTEKGMTKKELANALNITTKNLDQIFSKRVPSGLLSKINLPLINLYCRTKW